MNEIEVSIRDSYILSFNPAELTMARKQCWLNGMVREISLVSRGTRFDALRTEFRLRLSHSTNRRCYQMWLVKDIDISAALAQGWLLVDEKGVGGDHRFFLEDLGIEPSI